MHQSTMFSLHDHKTKSTKQPFKVPEGYFDQNKTNVLNALGNKHSPKVIRFNAKNIAYFAVAASIVLFVFIFNFSDRNKHFNKDNQQITLVDIPEEYLEEIDLIEISSLSNKPDTVDIEKIEYLIHQDISLELIAENL